MERVDYESMVVQELIGFNEREELDLSPWYQRRSVWSRSQQAYLVNTLFEQKPVPTIYVRHSLDVEREKSVREVVDGQQRIRSILKYVAGDFPARHPEHEKRVRYSDLTKAQKLSFRMTKLSIGYLIDAADADVIEIFGRLNSVSKTLNEQEKRNARFSGEFKQFCLRQAADRVALWLALGVFSANDIARMKEIQFVADLTWNMLEGLSDYQARRLTRFYADFDEEFDQATDIAARLERVFRLVASINLSAVKDTVFNRPPLFFSLLLVLDSAKRLPSARKLESVLHSVDNVLNADLPLSDRPPGDAEFIAACTSSTQRIKSRKIRGAYLRNALGL